MEGQSIMTDNPVELDEHRGMAAQKLTEIRRRLLEVADTGVHGDRPDAGRGAVRDVVGIEEGVVSGC
jgi:hypothetical protein